MVKHQWVGFKEVRGDELKGQDLGIHDYRLRKRSFQAVKQLVGDSKKQRQ